MSSRDKVEWPKESRDLVKRLGVPHARLYPYVTKDAKHPDPKKEVVTPEGRGFLLQVFSDRAFVLLHNTKPRESARNIKANEYKPMTAIDPMKVRPV